MASLAWSGLYLDAALEATNLTDKRLNSWKASSHQIRTSTPTTLTAEKMRVTNLAAALTQAPIRKKATDPSTPSKLWMNLRAERSTTTSTLTENWLGSSLGSLVAASPKCVSASVLNASTCTTIVWTLWPTRLTLWPSYASWGSLTSWTRSLWTHTSATSSTSSRNTTWEQTKMSRSGFKIERRQTVSSPSLVSTRTAISLKCLLSMPAC